MIEGIYSGSRYLGKKGKFGNVTNFIWTITPGILD